MTPERWQQVKQIFESARQHPPAERAAFLSNACGADESLRAELESLIAPYEKDGTFLDSPAYEAAAEQLERGHQLRRGQVIGHHEIISKLGEGGMGEVYLAQDRKLGRQVALKFLLSQFTKDSERLGRFEQEARAASALNHPNILTIHEIGEADSHVFIATEFVDGETLRRRIAAGAIGISETLSIAEQVASALAAAHAKGIIHRDVKPDNIMLRGDGIVKVLDFGLAKLAEETPGGPEDPTRAMLRTRTGVVMGTVTYMSPEQARGLPVDTRTDVWSLGVSLYEMIVGRIPFDGPTNSDVIVSILEREPPSLMTSAPDTPEELQRIVTKALRKNREERYQGVKDLLVDLKALRQDLELQAKLRALARESVHPKNAFKAHAQVMAAPDYGSPRTVSFSSRLISGIRRKRLIAVSLLVALVIMVIGAYFIFLKHHSALTEKDTILLADFVNSTGDSTFDGSTLKQALAVQLRQTPFLNLFPEQGVRETLRYMGRQEDEKLTKDIAREICVRRGLKATLVGSIASLGRNYAITLEAINGQTGETIASQQVEAEGKEQVLKSLGQAALELRKQLGESLSTLQKYDAPIEQATTSSLEALNVYSKGLEQIYRGDYKSALPLFNRAVELDPNFAEAYVWLSWTYGNSSDFAKTEQIAEKAYTLRGRVTELEKLHIDELYHLWATGDFEKQKDADELIEHLYPNDWLAHNGLMLGYYRLGQLEQALAEGNQGIRVNPNESHLYWHVSSVLIRLNRFNEARDVIKQGQARRLDHSVYRLNLYMIALASGDAAEMQQQLELMRKADGEGVALTTQARTALFFGRWREAQELYRRAANLPGQPSALGTNASLPVTATIAGALFGFCQGNRDEIKQSLALSRLNSSYQIMFVPILANGSLCGDSSEAQKLADEQTKRYPRATQLNVYSVPLIRAAIALQREHADQSLEVLNPAIAYDGGNAAFWPDYLRGQSYLRLRRGNEAASEFQKIIDHRGWDVASPFYPLAYLGLARAAVLNGDAAKARSAYQNFFAIWKDADPDLPIIIDAKKEYEKLK